MKLAHEAAGEKRPDEQGEGDLRHMFTAYFRASKSERRSLGKLQESLFVDVSPAQAVALKRFLAIIQQTGHCIVVTDLDEMLTAFSGGDIEHSTIEVLADYLTAGGVLVFNAAAPFDWFYYRLLRPLTIQLGPRSRLLANVLLVLTGGSELYVFHDGAYRLVSRTTGKHRSEGFDALVKLSREKRFSSVPELDPEKMTYIGDSSAAAGIDDAIAGAVGIVIDVGDAMLDMTEQPMVNLHRGYLRMIDLIVGASAALQESGRAKDPEPSPDAGDTVLWTFERKHFPRDRRLRVRVGGSGYVHAGVMRPDSAWDPVYNVPLTPLQDGRYEAVLPSGVNAFTFFWTEAPWDPGHPGHWESGPRGVFEATAGPGGS